MREIKRVVETKENGKWTVSHETTDRETIYTELAKRLISKKLHKCTYIRSIKEKCNYDGTRTITIYYDGDVRDIYTIEA